VSDVPFETGFAKALEAAYDAAHRGLVLAGMRLIRDAVMEQPTVPIDTGHLRGSGTVHARNVMQYASAEFGSGTPNNGPEQTGALTAVVGFNQPQAARLHEHPEYHFTDPDAGGKYLELKMQRNAKAYGKIIGAAIKERL
jgi:hypothetical protein